MILCKRYETGLQGQPCQLSILKCLSTVHLQTFFKTTIRTTIYRVVMDYSWCIKGCLFEWFHLQRCRQQMAFIGWNPNLVLHHRSNFSGFSNTGVLNLAAGQVLGLVLLFNLGLWCNWWLGFYWGSCQSICFLEDCRGFSPMSNQCLFNSVHGGTKGRGFLHLSSNGRLVAVTGAAEATHTLSRRLGAVQQ